MKHFLAFLALCRFGHIDTVAALRGRANAHAISAQASPGNICSADCLLLLL